MFSSEKSKTNVNPSPARKRRRFGIQSFLGGLFIILSIVSGLSLAYIGYTAVSRGLDASVKRRSASIARDITRGLHFNIHGPIQSFTDRVTRSPLMNADTLEKRLSYMALLQMVLQTTPFVSIIMIGYGNGDLFAVRVFESDEEKALMGAPLESTLFVIECHGAFQPSRASFMFFNNNLTLMGQGAFPLFDNFDPRTREWYITAMQREGQAEVGPFYFPSLNRQGIAFSKKSFSDDTVVGVIVHMQQLSDMLKDERLTPSSRAVLLNAKGIPIAGSPDFTGIAGGIRGAHDSNNVSAVFQRTMELYKDGDEEESLDILVDGRKWVVSVMKLPDFSASGYKLAVAIPRDELFTEVERFLRDILIGFVGLIVVTAALMGVAARRISRPLKELAQHASRPSGKGTELHRRVESSLVEIRTLAKGVNTLHGDLQKILDLLKIIGTEQNMSRLLERTIRVVVDIIGVHGGILVLWDKRAEKPSDAQVYWKDAVVDDLSVPGRNQHPKLVMYEAMEMGTTLHASIFPEDPQAWIGPLKPTFIDPSIVRADVICVPLFTRNGESLGVFGLTKRITQGREDTVSFPPELTEYIETIANAISVVLETQALFKGQQDLRDALIHILAGAIDAKSPYTGGHCARVPAIFHMLLQAAHDDDQGSFKDFVLDENGWETARLAAWLHDCGKITTPEYVVDKATKLETLYDRIHEIRTRFEVIKREAEIASLRAILAGADQEAERLRLADELRKLDEDFAFIASCNAGGEGMDEDDAARIAAIGQRTWMRTLDKRLGVSREERERMDRAGVEAVPTCEMLLCDQPEHVIPRGEKDRLPEDNKWGFNLKMPKNLYNRGELYNLLIPRGTLTAEERYKINDHIMKTIIMLDLLPLPKELSDVPKIAGVHHERMDGGGYPCGLTFDQMGLPGRMLAIADIFEALTASDRPYKTSKKLSEALRIMNGMKENGHIDPNLYNFFIQAGIPQRYAKEYLTPEQNDL